MGQVTMTRRQAEVLSLIEGGTVTAPAIAVELHVSHSAVNQVLRRMVEAGLVVRELQPRPGGVGGAPAFIYRAKARR